MKKYIKEITIITIIALLIMGVAIVNKTKMANTVLTSTNPEQSQIESLSNKKIGWGIQRNDNHEQPDVGTTNKEIMDKYQGLYMGNAEQKYIYLTFDMGYEAGYTEKILEVLKQNDVKATFFITAHYLNTQPELTKRMIDEGHIVGNHIPNTLMYHI